MHELEVIVLDDPRVISTPDELSAVLVAGSGEGNHFMIASATAQYPMLDLLVRDDYAVLHFFDEAGEAGHQAVSNVSEPPDEVEFPDSSMGDTLSMPGSVLIDTATAVRCVEEFAETLARPTLVEWTEL